MSELPPPRVRGQRSGTCTTCKARGRKGAIRFYPRPLSSAEEPLLADGPEPGMWAHLDAADWLEGEPHEPVPEED